MAIMDMTPVFMLLHNTEGTIIPVMDLSIGTGNIAATDGKKHADHIDFIRNLYYLDRETRW